MTVDRATEPLSESSAQRLYEVIRRRIILGELAQGVRLPEQRLADELQTSRIPLREALSKLDAEGFVELRPRRGAVVTTWTVEAVHHLFDSRLALETSAANKAAQQAAQGASLEALEVALERSEEQMRSGDDLAFAEANVRFHQALVAQAGNPLTDRLMASIAGQMVWLFHLTSQRDHEVACRAHRSIVEAVRSGNPRLTETLTYSHIEIGRKPSFEVLSALLGITG
ncbi:GntR family transcriptional regulator [Nesterenkonia alkaliphila]|uniref:FCD domain-containing protein n=1 Tax=Nesterenkonia alkaliphila TaxID=1463631 RepID=A0A7K1UJR8_9MICC|nr:GntR family transcriptional regulator [Nesterenkonia alkaliphila]MVT26710.1 FCD domain-containing protein [Nesterenkonia alkaliphila]GFZ76903.1 GntR family transcriptional regulator [Nesterenkonia alkaliphila]